MFKLLFRRRERKKKAIAKNSNFELAVEKNIFFHTFFSNKHTKKRVRELVSSSISTYFATDLFTFFGSCVQI